MMDPFIKQPFHYAVNNPNYCIGISTRYGGVSSYPKESLNLAHYIDDQTEHVIENQNRLAEAIDFDRDDWVFPIQIHSNKVCEVTAHDKGSNIETIDNRLYGYDGLYTKEKGLLLTMCFADCVPVYMFSEDNDFIALAHAGWRGTKTMVVKEIIQHYSNPEKLICYIGPSITKDYYEVNEEIKDQFVMPFNVEPFFEKNNNGHFAIDLQNINKQILISCGVKAENIHITSHCTAANDDFFSYRTEKGQTGRMLAFIGMRE